MPVLPPPDAHGYYFRQGTHPYSEIITSYDMSKRNAKVLTYCGLMDCTGNSPETVFFALEAS